MSVAAIGAYLAFTATLTAPTLVRPPSEILQSQASKTTWGSFVDSSRRSIGSGIRDSYFFNIPSVLEGDKLERFQFEQTFFSNFFNPEKSLDPNFVHQQKIRDSLSIFDQKIEVATSDGREVLFTLRVLESSPENSKGTDLAP